MTEAKSSKDLVKLIDEGRSEIIAKMGALKQVLNLDPPKKWLKYQQFTKTEYLPIDKVENLLDSIFQDWWPEVREIKQIAQSIVCTVRVHYRNPVTSEWMSTDGVGAVAIQTDKGYSAADLGHIKSDAIQKAAPAAKSYALKDAAEHIGKIFGRDLNRKDTESFHNFYEDADEQERRKAGMVEKRVELMKKYKNYAKVTDEEAAIWVYRHSDSDVEEWMKAWATGDRPFLHKKPTPRFANAVFTEDGGKLKEVRKDE